MQHHLRMMLHLGLSRRDAKSFDIKCYILKLTSTQHLQLNIYHLLFFLGFGSD